MTQHNTHPATLIDLMRVFKSSPTLSDFNFRNKMAWVGTILNSYAISCRKWSIMDLVDRLAPVQIDTSLVDWRELLEFIKISFWFNPLTVAFSSPQQGSLTVKGQFDSRISKCILFVLKDSNLKTVQKYSKNCTHLCISKWKKYCSIFKMDRNEPKMNRKWIGSGPEISSRRDAS